MYVRGSPGQELSRQPSLLPVESHQGRRGRRYLFRNLSPGTPPNRTHSRRASPATNRSRSSWGQCRRVSTRSRWCRSGPRKRGRNSLKSPAAAPNSVLSPVSKSKPSSPGTQSSSPTSMTWFRPGEKKMAKLTNWNILRKSKKRSHLSNRTKVANSLVPKARFCWTPKINGTGE